MFQKSKNGEVIWVAPKEDDLKNFRKAIEGNKSGVIPLTNELKAKVDDALRNMAPQQNNLEAIIHSNKSIYRNIKSLVQSPRGLVDIVLPVYNSFHLVKKCIRCVLERTHWPYHLYIVDDCSDNFTKERLEEIQKNHPDKISLIRNKKNRGFAASVNRGMKAGNGLYICFLNSDVFVTDLWLTKMIMALMAEERNQIACPATNNTAIVEIPLSPGASYIRTNQIFENFAIRRYPELMPTGFCMLFGRDLTDKIGYLDASYGSYGEDTQFWYDTIRYAENDVYKKYRGVMVDDTYVFHQRTGSFSQLGSETHMQLRKLASGRFNRLNPSWVDWKKRYNVNRELGNLREKIPVPIINMDKDSYRVCWVVYQATLCGGMAYITDIVNELIERGVNAKVAVIKRDPDGREDYMGELTTAPVFFNSYDEFVQNFRSKVFPSGIVIASTIEATPVVQILHQSYPSEITPVLHVQSYEPDLVQEPELKEKCINTFNTARNVISSSHWITEILKNKHNLDVIDTINPGVNMDLFYKRADDRDDDCKTVMIPMMTGYACKGYGRGLELISELERLADEHGIDLRILVYGVESLPTLNTAVCLGRLPPVRLATILGSEVDVFIDPSTLHSYGLPALEALASGVKVFSWDNKGVFEYGKDLVSIYNNDTTVTTVAEDIIDYLEKAEPVNYEQIRVALVEHNREKSVDSFINTFEGHFNLRFQARKISMIIPHMRKHGGPTTMISIANELSNLGHDVSISVVYPEDINDEVADFTTLPISVNARKLGPTDLIITNSDNPMTEAVGKLKDVKKIMLKLSHNPRFKNEETKGLQQKWDAVVTSSEWLKEVCENPTEGWNYKPCKATRIGWWHYGFKNFQRHPSTRQYGGAAGKPIIISTLMHAHPLKGTKEAIRACGEIYKKYGNTVQFAGVGEIPKNVVSINLPNFQYLYEPTRDMAASAMQQTDIWIGASKSEGLGRMGLEAMSAGCAVILGDTGCEYAEHEQNCLIVNQDDPKEIAAAVERIIEDKALATKLREEAYNTACRYANPKPCITKLQEVIDSVFENK